MYIYIMCWIYGLKSVSTTVRTQKNAWANVPKQKPKETVVEEEVDVDDDEESAPGSRPW